MVFEKDYSNLYDRFYRGKNYSQECDLIEAVFKRCQTKPRTILDLGCGTGSHAVMLAKRGYTVTGVDRSLHMLETAKKKARAEKVDISFIQQDISQLTPELLKGEQFDVVISMFAVIGYLTENDQLARTFHNIREFLKPGGVFLFDCWYGPAVLSQRPETRVHSYEIGNNHKVMRLVTPELDTLRHIVDIHYRVLEIEGEQVLGDVSETHRMRYLFPMETKYFLETAGFRNIGLNPFMEMERELTPGDWNMLVTAR
jgi:SAM-dependent methyltransferase